MSATFNRAAFCGVPIAPMGSQMPYSCASEIVEVAMTMIVSASRLSDSLVPLELEGVDSQHAE